MKLKVVVIGVSAGGPDVLKRLFKSINKVNAPVIIAQHNISSNAEDFAQWLSGELTIPVKIVDYPCELQKNVIYLTSGKGDLYFPNERTVSVKNSSEKISPNIDVLFESAAEIFKDKVVGIILSGLGKDGVRGARKIIENGGKVFVQNDARFSYLPDLVSKEVKGVMRRSLEEIGLMLSVLL